MDPSHASSNETTFSKPLSKRNATQDYDDDQMIVFGNALKPDESNFNRIHSGTIQYDGKVVPSVEIQLLPFEPLQECREKLNFTWEIVDYAQDEMHIQVNFEDPICVSATSNEGDALEIIFFEQALFKDLSGNMIPPRASSKTKVKRQYEKDAE